MAGFSEHSDTQRYLNLLDAARRRGEIPDRIPLKTGKPCSKKTLMDLFDSKKLPPKQQATLAIRLFGEKKSKPKQSAKAKTIKKAVVKRVTVVDNAALLKKFKAMKKKKMADAYKSEDRCAHIRSVGNGL